MAPSEVVRRQHGLLDLLSAEAAPVATTTSDAHGDFAFRDLEAGTYVVDARGRDETCALSALTRVELGTYSAVPLLLGPVGAVGGRILAAEGAPFVGRVLIHPADAPTPLPHVAPRWATIGPDGTFLVERVPAGRWLVFAGRGGTRWERVADVEVQAQPSASDGGTTRRTDEQRVERADARAGPADRARPRWRGSRWPARGSWR
jgi:hypothetical protein